MGRVLEFTAGHRGGSGPPLVCLHGFTATWRAWELVLPALERRHMVLAPTLPGHRGGPPLAPDHASTATLLDQIEVMLDSAGCRRVSLAMTERCEHIAPELLAHQMLASATCPGLQKLNEVALREGYSLDAERITCPVRIVWGTADRLLAWRSCAVRYADDWLPTLTG